MSEGEHDEDMENAVDAPIIDGDNPGAWPALEKIRERYKKGEILIMTGGHKGRSRLAELALLKSIGEEQRPDLIAFEGDLPKPIVIEAREEYEPFVDRFEHPTGKRRKPKKRKLKRKFRP